MDINDYSNISNKWASNKTGDSRRAELAKTLTYVMTEPQFLNFSANIKIL